MKKVLLIGNNENAKYHHLKDVDCEIKLILQNKVQLHISSDYTNFSLKDFQQYDLIINYIDQWDALYSDRIAAFLVSYVAQGGCMLALHNGVISSLNYELTQLYGGTFVMHPPYTHLPYNPESNHLITAGIEPFTLDEEPYFLEANCFVKKDVFLSYAYGDSNIPCGWTRQFARGRVIYLAPGHNAITFQDKFYRQVLLNCVLWACGELTDKEGISL